MTKPSAPTAAEIDEDLKRQFEALGIPEKRQRPLADVIFDDLVDLARSTRAPVSVTAISRKRGVAQSTATRYCQELVSQGRAFTVEFNGQGNRFRYVPKVV
ncbi:MAG TPA: helix-turn-helix domain-containing protein [Thermoanaerobaculales bacterium]|nr:helix-turn-helix domain-containing protein [Thermoanaerobaculales bacterium]